MVMVFLVLGKCFFVKPFKFWVENTIFWISFFLSSPWLWKDRFVVGGEAMSFLIDLIVSNISGLRVVMMLVLMLMLLLGKHTTIISVTVISNCWWWSSYWWYTFHWDFTIESIETIAWLLFHLGKSSWIFVFMFC